MHAVEQSEVSKNRSVDVSEDWQTEFHSDLATRAMYQLETILLYNAS